MRLLVLPRAKGRISVVARAHRHFLAHFVPRLLFCIISSPYFKFSFFLTVSMQLCGKSIADTSLRLRDVNFRAHKRGARYNVYVHIFFLLLLFFFLLKPGTANNGEHISTCMARLFNLYFISVVKSLINVFFFFFAIINYIAFWKKSYCNWWYITRHGFLSKYYSDMILLK